MIAYHPRDHGTNPGGGGGGWGRWLLLHKIDMGLKLGLPRDGDFATPDLGRRGIMAFSRTGFNTAIARKLQRYQLPFNLFI